MIMKKKCSTQSSLCYAFYVCTEIKLSKFTYLISTKTTKRQLDNSVIDIVISSRKPDSLELRTVSNECKASWS